MGEYHQPPQAPIQCMGNKFTPPVLNRTSQVSQHQGEIAMVGMEVSIPHPPGPMIWGLHSSPDCYEGLVSYSWTTWSNLGAISNLSSFLEWAIAKVMYWHKHSFPSYQLPSDIGGHAHDNPILERLGIGHSIARGFFLVCGNPPPWELNNKYLTDDATETQHRL